MLPFWYARTSDTEGGRGMSDRILLLSFLAEQKDFTWAFSNGPR
jgi:hypothetical protein